MDLRLQMQLATEPPKSRMRPSKYRLRGGFRYVPGVGWTLKGEEPWKGALVNRANRLLKQELYKDMYGYNKRSGLTLYGLIGIFDDGAFR